MRQLPFRQKGILHAEKSNLPPGDGSELVTREHHLIVCVICDRDHPALGAIGTGVSTSPEKGGSENQAIRTIKVQKAVVGAFLHSVLEVASKGQQISIVVGIVSELGTNLGIPDK